MDGILDLFDGAKGLAIIAVLVPIGGFVLSVVARIVLGRVIGGLFGGLSRFVLDKPIPAATLKSTPTDGTITLRQIMNGQLGQLTEAPADPTDRIKVLEELHARGGISADKLSKLKAAIASGD
ncbi:hypothetical protein [Aeromicrobium sp.]|uniref:hypothetical protein n=1 Tax=Aeromicrobium sp. TaxID=1871063 RepID=UPI002FC74647